MQAGSSGRHVRLDRNHAPFFGEPGNDKFDCFGAELVGIIAPGRYRNDEFGHEMAYPNDDATHDLIC